MSAPSSLSNRLAELDALGVPFPLARNEHLAELLTVDDVATLKHIVAKGQGPNTLRALASDLAYLEAWSQAATGAPLPWPTPEELLLKFVAHHLWDPAQRELDSSHGMPDHVMDALRAAGRLRTDGPHAPSTVRRRLSCLATLHRWRGLPCATKSETVRSAVNLAARAASWQPARHSERAITRDLLDRLLAGEELMVAAEGIPQQPLVGLRIAAGNLLEHHLEIGRVELLLAGLLHEEADPGAGLRIDPDDELVRVGTPPGPDVPEPGRALERYFLRLLDRLGHRGAAHGYHELVRDVMQRLVRDAGLNMCGYEYKDGCFRLDSVQSYFKMNLAMLDLDVRHSLFPEDKPVYTKVRDQLPARYLEHAKAVNTMVADGCIINGTVEHSVLFRGVKIDEGAHVKNCVLMQDCHIESGAQLENCILDKQALIKTGSRLIGPSAYPIVISKNMVI